jgi:hypothetical protein
MYQDLQRGWNQLKRRDLQQVPFFFRKKVEKPLDFFSDFLYNYN